MSLAILDDFEEIRKTDKSNMLSFCVELPRHCCQASKIAEDLPLPSSFKTARNIIVAGMGGSGIGGELLKDWARDKVPVPIEVIRGYSLPAYAGAGSLVFAVSYSGETEESLSVFLDALKKKCMICCISSGGTMLKFAKKIEIPSVRVPSGIPPRAALPYLFIPMLSVLEKTGQAPSITGDLSEAKDVLARISALNLPKRPTKDNFSKTLAWNINQTVPAVFGFGIYRGIAQRFKQQFNENSKIPSTWGYLPELDHNEIVGWEDKEKLQLFSQIFIRDAAESAEIRSRIESTKALMPADSKVFEVWSQGESELTKMLSALSIGDFTSVYLAVLRKVDPTPVETIQLLKNRIKRTGTKEKIVRELEKTATK